MSSWNGCLPVCWCVKASSSGDRLQIPIRAGRVDVTEIGGEQRHPPVDVLAGLLPVEQRPHREGVPEIVWPRAAAGAAALQADLADQLRERLVELLAGDPSSSRGDEEC